MTQSTVSHLLDLSDELLLMIMSKISNTTLLQSCVGASERLDRLACDFTHTRSIDLTEGRLTDQFWDHLLPRIHQNIECLTLDASSIHRVVQSLNYPKLTKLTLSKLDLEYLPHYFDEQKSSISIFKEQIRHLTVELRNMNTDLDLTDVAIDGYLRIINLFPTITHLHFISDTAFQHPPLDLFDLPSTAFHSSTIVHLSITVVGLDDCIRLLDGRLSRLHTLIVEVFDIQPIPNDLNNTKPLPDLKCFSLISYESTHEYDNCVVPLLHRMIALEQLTLSLTLKERTTFVDGNHLENEIRKRMVHLSTFNFHFLTFGVPRSNDYRPSTDDIRHTFASHTSFDCYVDYTKSGRGWCHIYSLPFSFERLRGITNAFPGGRFIHVRNLLVTDPSRPFEYEFFQRISVSFPLLEKLAVINLDAQQRSRQCCQCERKYPPVEYPHLTHLDIYEAHITYAEQFLTNTRTIMPRLNTINIRYETLVTVTENFTNDATRLNCFNLKTVHVEEVVAHSNDFYLYFPSLST